MSTIKTINNYYAVCIKTCEVYEPIEQTIEVLLLGDLVKVRTSDCNSCTIQIFDREAQSLGNYIYQCEKEYLSEISNNIWPYVSCISLESIIKVRMVLSGERVLVNFQVKFFGKITTQDQDQFYGLQLMPTPNLTKKNINELNNVYLSPTLRLIIMAADKLILNLVVNEVNNEDQMVGAKTHRVQKTIQISSPMTSYNFKLVPCQDLIDLNNKNKWSNPHNHPSVPKSIQNVINLRRSVTPDNSTSTDPTPLSMTKFVLPKITDSSMTNTRMFDTSDRSDSSNFTTLGIKSLVLPEAADSGSNNTTHNKEKSRKNQRTEEQNDRKCNNCCKCGKIDDFFIQLDCLHIFCPDCLMNSLNDSNLGDSYCPYSNGSYNCRYNLTANDIQYILDTINGSIIKKCDPPKPKRFFHKCPGCQLNCTTGGRDIYQCTNCKRRNMVDFKKYVDQQVKPYNPAPPPTRQQTPVLSKLETWTCTNCKYDENLIDSRECIICNKKNDKFVHKSNGTEYYRLLELEENVSFIPNFHQFHCVFCDETIAPENGVQLRSCLHTICRKCVVAYIESQAQAHIKCPHTICSHFLEDREIKTLLTPQSYDKHLEKSINMGILNLTNSFRCCMPGCVGFYEVDDINAKYVCPTCNIENCIQCKASHPGITCATFKAQPK